MRVGCLLGSLMLVLFYLYGSSLASEIDIPVLLNRLDSAKGNRQAIDVLKLLVKLADSDTGELNVHPTSMVVETIEEIIVASAPGGHSAIFLNQVKARSKNIILLSNTLESKLANLPWRSRLLFGSSVRKIVSNYLGYELRSMRLIKARVLLGEQTGLQNEILPCFARCTAALSAALRTLSLMQKADMTQLRATVRKTFGEIGSHIEQDVGRSLAVSISVQKNATVFEDHIKYLRENLAVIIKSGMFMVFCFTFKIYICTFVFGVLLTMSTIIWIAIFLQLIDV